MSNQTFSAIAAIIFLGAGAWPGLAAPAVAPAPEPVTAAAADPATAPAAAPVPESAPVAAPAGMTPAQAPPDGALAKQTAAVPDRARQDGSFFCDVRCGMPLAALTALGALPAAEGQVTIPASIDGQPWEGRGHLKDGRLAAMTLTGRREHGPALDKALRQAAFFPVHVEIDGATFDLAQALRQGQNPQEAMQALMAFFQNAGKPGRMRTAYAEEATFASLAESGAAFPEGGLSAPAANVVLTVADGPHLRALVCPYGELDGWLAQHQENLAPLPAGQAPAHPPAP